MAHYPMGGAGVMGNGAHGAIVYRGYGVQGYRPHGAYGQWGTGVWGTGVWAMGYRGMQPMGNGGTGGMGYKRYGPHGQWGTGGMKHMGNEAHWGVWVQGYEAQGYGVQGVWATWAKGYRGMGNGAHGQFAPKISKRCQVVKKMSSCQKDVKCQTMKHLDYGGGSQKN